MQLLLEPRSTTDVLADLLFPRRVVQGGQHHRAKLSDEDVVNIRALKASGMTHRAVADIYGVSHSTIESIALGRRRART